MAKPRSTVRDREDVLGVLKVATATQVMHVVRPGLSDNKVIRNALLVCQAAGQVRSEGDTAGPAGRLGAPDRGGVAELWNLTDPGLDAARRLLERDADQMGGSARGVGRGGAPHAMAVNATIIAIIRGGIGGITSWRTEVPHPLSSTGKRNVRADAVLCAPDDGLPLLMLEVDRGTEPVSRVSAKLASYVAFYRRSVNDPGEPSDWTARMTGTGQVPFWETLYPDTGLPGWPPLAAAGHGLHRRRPPRAGQPDAGCRPPVPGALGSRGTRRP